jgi:hypothetical protein
MKSRPSAGPAPLPLVAQPLLFATNFAIDQAVFDRLSPTANAIDCVRESRCCGNQDQPG